jgi:hypothetical protein
MTEETKSRFPNLGTGRQLIENIDYLVIVVSAIMVSAGIGLGSFVPGTIILSVLGSFFIMVGIAVYLLLQLKEA